MDLYDIRDELTEEEAMVQDSVARMVDEKSNSCYPGSVRTTPFPS